MRALLSVSDKTHLLTMAELFQEKGIEVVSTGGTHKYLVENGFQVTNVSDVTGFPEILDGRVKTLHPKVHGGLLADTTNETHRQTLTEQDIIPFEYVVVNLYPFKETISQPDVTYAEAIENIDIGGPAMIRSAAKNAKNVTVVVDPQDYTTVANWVRTQGELTAEQRKKLQAKAFRHTAAYDALIANYLTASIDEWAPEKLSVTYEKVDDLRYGENSHQKASFYKTPLSKVGQLTTAKQLNGKALSYNNIKDANAALEMIAEFDTPTAVAVKHMNPCGVGQGETIAEAFDACYAGDPVSIFGGIVVVNRAIGEELAEKLAGIFLEIVIAPSFTETALTRLQKKKNLRLLQIPVEDQVNDKSALVSVSGGLLLQEHDQSLFDTDDYKVVTTTQPTEVEKQRLLFGMKVVKHTKSNAIVLVNDKQTIGIGAGQMNRVGAAKIAIEQAVANGFDLSKAALASDAFFPMSDTVALAAEYGIPTIIQPGGSIKDQDSIDEANTHNISMVFTGQRHFKH